MPLESAIVDWAATRPSWQRAILGRVAGGEVLSDADHDRLIEQLLSSEATTPTTFGLEHFRATEAGGPSVVLVSISDPEHVNALSTDTPLTFEPHGLTIIYGDNGSGKSGYARLLKRIARSRHREDVLSDVFRDSTLTKPQAKVTVKIGEEECHLLWPDSTRPELQRILFYDEACGETYVSTESDFPYRPSALSVLDGLIQSCLAIRARIDVRLEQNAASRQTLPLVDSEVGHTPIGRFLASLSGDSSLEVFDGILRSLEGSSHTLEELRLAEERLRSSDTRKEQYKLLRTATKLQRVQEHLQALEVAFGDSGIATLDSQRSELTTLQRTSGLLAQAFGGEPLGGVGGTAWQNLWESARRYSAVAYPDATFPVVEGARCPLCQQLIEDEARDRFSRFERFVRDDSQSRLHGAQEAWNSILKRLETFNTMPDAVESNLNDLQAEHQSTVEDIRALVGEYDTTRLALLTAIANDERLPETGLSSGTLLARLQAAATSARNVADNLSDPETIQALLMIAVEKRKERELLDAALKSRETVRLELVRLHERERLEGIKGAAATGPITNKILELSQDSITEVVRDTFTRETDRLKLERVTIAKTRAEKGALLHQPKLVGARQDATLPRVFSEGERTALGLAAFFTEASLDTSRSALILDDPVTSLDHIRRSLVATRLAEMAATRQVIVATHDVAFVADLKREAKGLAVPVADRSVARSRSGDRRPGICGEKHPWKAKDVGQRLGELREQVARIRKDSPTWDDRTYENEVATWAGDLSETWERIFSQEIVGQVVAEGGLEVRPAMVKVLSRFTANDDSEFQASYSRVSQWVKRHDKSGRVNFVPPEIDMLEQELTRVIAWFNRVKGYKQ